MMHVVYRDFQPSWHRPPFWRRPTWWRAAGMGVLWLVLTPVLSGLFWYAAIRACLMVIL